MNPFAIISMLMGSNRRTCSKCKRVQIVSARKRGITVSCKFCSADIPPPIKR